ncbi:hypothetical protein BO71DRAFT_176245 [Aspergillus ellipticus CBS 707.79]|uniref:Uncharacterized protein n=1 Tax=Aspergillus ellipticus CBS 707.79 TaxID=1448320 RepID=A0A319DQS8_9EURO|nr:hypothetical protein BO71DRAFT_176245 [Aspergillus ellipticus CBS 707.79]
MLDTSLPHDFPTWASMGPSDHPALNTESAPLDEELYGSQLGINGFDFSLSQLANSALCPEFDLAAGETPTGFYDTLQPMGLAEASCAPGFAEKITSLFGESSFNIAPDAKRMAADLSLNDLLRSTSQLATERALYMNNPASTPSPRASHDSPSARLHFAASPIADDPCSSPGASHQSYSGSESDWDREYNYREPAQFYGLPEIGFSDPMMPLDHTLDDVMVQPPPFGASLPNPNAAPRRKSQVGQVRHPSHHDLDADDEESGLTPLEMPDGSTRFTTNWLPVDPEGGFTIRAPQPPRVRHHDAPNHAFCSDPADAYHFPHDAFISLPAD